MQLVELQKGETIVRLVAKGGAKNIPLFMDLSFMYINIIPYHKYVCEQNFWYTEYIQIYTKYRIYTQWLVII